LNTTTKEANSNAILGALLGGGVGGLFGYTGKGNTVRNTLGGIAAGAGIGGLGGHVLDSAVKDPGSYGFNNPDEVEMIKALAAAGLLTGGIGGLLNSVSRTSDIKDLKEAPLDGLKPTEAEVKAIEAEAIPKLPVSEYDSFDKE